MPQFVFRLHSREAVRERAVDNVPDAESALVVAKFVARELAGESVAAGSLDLSCSLHVSDEHGAFISELPLARFLDVRP